MSQTPRAELAFCRKNRLLRPICPRRIPASSAGAANQGRQEYYCGTRNSHESARETLVLFPGNRCVFAEWGYEIVTPLSGLTTGTQISAWDGTGWFRPGYALLTPPPWHVHVDVQASVGSQPAGGFAWPEGAQSVSDALLNPNRDDAVSLGWVRWSGVHGQLVLAPTNINGGLWAGHLIFSYAAGGVDYAITLHAWVSMERISGRHVNRVLRFESGSALPHVIASLKSIVGSALRS